jgi:beta-phosphoglucomutase-like phosphatase (HAD superfamily)
MHEAGGKGIERLPGVNELLGALRKGGARWGICTSGAFVLLPSPSPVPLSNAPFIIAATRTYANSALTTGEIGSTPPDLPFLITADDVVNGKPNPDPYLKGMDGPFPFLLDRSFFVPSFLPFSPLLFRPFFPK